LKEEKMLTYITAFIFYTLAMIGILLIGFVIYKKTFVLNRGESKNMMKILDCLQIAPKKNLLIVKVKNEKFLIASGAEHTTFLARLDDSKSDIQKQTNPIEKNIINKTEISDNAYMSNPTNYMSKYSESEKAKEAFQIQKAKLDKIQKQFRELYETESKRDIPKDNISQRKEAVKQLLKELNETTSYKM